MSDKRNNKDYSIKLKKQHDIFMDTIVRMAGRTMERSLKDTFFRDRFINNKMQCFYISLDDNPIAEMKLAQLDRERAIIDMREYESMITKTHEVVKKETKAAVEEAINELTKEFK